MAVNQKNDVAVEFTVKGQEELNAALKQIKSNIGAVTDAANQQAAADAKVAAAQAQAIAIEKARTAQLKNLAGAGNNWVGVLKSSAQGVSFLGEGMSKTLAIFGPWGAAAGAALGIATALWGRLSKPEDTKPSEDQLARLTEAYKSLGAAASLAAAEMKVAADEAAKQADKELIENEKRIRDLQKEIDGINKDFERGYVEIQTWLGTNRATIDDQMRNEMQQRAAAAQAELDQRKGYVDFYKQSLKDIQHEEEQAADKARDAEIRRQTAVELNAKDNAARAEARRKEEQDAAKRAADAEKARQLSVQQRLQQEAKLAALVNEVERANVAASGDAVAAVNYEYKLKAAQAAKDFTDQKMRQQALALIEQQRLAAVAKAEEETQKKRDDLTKRAQSVTLTAVGGDSNLAKAQAAWDTLRAKIIGESQKIDSLLAEYEKTYSAEELKNNSEYLNLKNQQVQAVQNLADAQLNAYDRIAAARQADVDAEKQAIYDKVYAEKSLSKAQKQAVDAAKTGFETMAEGADAWGAASGAIQKANMLASAVQAGADAIDYGAQSLAYFAAGNPVAGAGMAAAAAGKTAAAAAYAAGLLDIGGSAPSQASGAAAAAAAGGGAPALTGVEPRQNDRELTVNFAFQGSDHQIAGAIIRGMNLSSAQLGSQKLRKSVISTRG